MTDAVLSVGADVTPDEHLDRLELHGHDLADVLEDCSRASLAEAVAEARRRRSPTHDGPLVLFTLDGRTLEADVAWRDTGVAIELHDVTRHVDETDRFARLALQLHRRNRDLQTLVDATFALGETLDVQALVQSTADALGDYLGEVTVVVTAAGHEGRHDGPEAVDPATHVTARALVTARGELGTVAWWRPVALDEGESRVVEVVLRKAAVAIDHALLLAPAPGLAEHDDLGLLRPPTARRALAGFVRPFALAMVGSADGAADVASLAGAVRSGRVGDVKAQWGPGRVLVALAGAGVPQLRSWLARTGVGAGEGPLGTWTVGIVEVADDVDAAIAGAGRALEKACAAGVPVLVAE